LASMALCHKPSGGEAGSLASAWRSEPKAGGVVDGSATCLAPGVARGGDGIPVAAAGSCILAHVLFGVRVGDPITLATAVLGITSSAAVAGGLLRQLHRSRSDQPCFLDGYRRYCRCRSEARSPRGVDSLCSSRTRSSPFDSQDLIAQHGLCNVHDCAVRPAYPD